MWKVTLEGELGEGKGHRSGKEVLGGGPGPSLTWVDVGQLSELANPGGTEGLREKAMSSDWERLSRRGRGP